MSALRLGRSSSPERPPQVKSHCKLNPPPFPTSSAATNIHSVNVAVKNSPSRVSPEQFSNLPQNQELAPAPIDPSIDKWFFISGAAN